MNEHDLINLKVLTHKAIRIRYLSLLTLEVIAVIGMFGFFIAAAMHMEESYGSALKLAGAAVALFFVALIGGKQFIRYEDISAGAYEALRSHKTSPVVRAYIDAVSAAGRDYMVAAEFNVIVNYAKYTVPFETAKTKLFANDSTSETDQEANASQAQLDNAAGTTSTPISNEQAP